MTKNQKAGAFQERWTYLKRLASLTFFHAIIISKSAPKMLIKGVGERSRGEGFFSDPVYNITWLEYARHVFSFAFSTIFLRMKKPTVKALAAAKSARTAGDDDDGVTTHFTDEHIEFVPPEASGNRNDADSCPSPISIIIFPGALVSPLAYSILARNFARAGYRTFIIRLPFGMADYGIPFAENIVGDPTSATTGDARATTKWVLVGHSLGSSGVEKFTRVHPSSVKGVVYIGASSFYGGHGMANLDIPMLALRGTRDPFTPLKKYDSAKEKWPKGYELKDVEGGNHMGFGSYLWQPMDWKATITIDEQQDIVIQDIMDFIHRRVGE